MGVSKNRGTPKSSSLTGFSIINHPFWGTPIFGNTHMHYLNIPWVHVWWFSHGFPRSDPKTDHAYSFPIEMPGGPEPFQVQHNLNVVKSKHLETGFACWKTMTWHVLQIHHTILYGNSATELHSATPGGCRERKFQAKEPRRFHLEAGHADMLKWHHGWRLLAQKSYTALQLTYLCFTVGWQLKGEGGPFINTKMDPPPFSNFNSCF